MDQKPNFTEAAAKAVEALKKAVEKDPYNNAKLDITQYDFTDSGDTYRFDGQIIFLKNKLELEPGTEDHLVESIAFCLQVNTADLNGNKTNVPVALIEAVTFDAPLAISGGITLVGNLLVTKDKSDNTSTYTHKEKLNMATNKEPIEISQPKRLTLSAMDWAPDTVEVLVEYEGQGSFRQTVPANEQGAVELTVQLGNHDTVMALSINAAENAEVQIEPATLSEFENIDVTPDSNSIRNLEVRSKVTGACSMNISDRMTIKVRRATGEESSIEILFLSAAKPGCNRKSD